MQQQTMFISTLGRGLYRIDEKINQWLSSFKQAAGICSIFISHTSASLLITENADPSVHEDLYYFLNRLIPDNDPSYTHTLEGKDDMSAHIRSALTQTSLCVPIADNALNLGTWQGIYLCEHRLQEHKRKIVITVLP